MRGSTFEDKTAYVEVSRQKHACFAGGRLTFKKLGSGLGGLVGMCRMFLEGQDSQNSCL